MGTTGPIEAYERVAAQAVPDLWAALSADETQIVVAARVLVEKAPGRYQAERDKANLKTLEMLRKRRTLLLADVLVLQSLISDVEGAR